MKGNIVLRLIALLLCPAAGVMAQDRCGYVAYTEQLHNKGTLREDSRQFEEWLEQQLAVRPLRMDGSAKQAVYRIPVVVHVVHKGEATGTGTNLTDEQIRSQISAINRDFNRQNADTVDTPDVFKTVAGRINIEFVLARQAPDGTATSGIVRVQGSKSRWSVADDAVLKSQSYWPAEAYLNIWVTDLTSTLLGYAQFPVSSLAGLEDAEDNRLTDGVVIDYRVFGDNNYGSFNLDDKFNSGRTTVHELGHFFGLRHIWGDDSGRCGGSGDYVNDTPDQANSTDGCPAHPYTTCSTAAMFQNYMDYTDDGCMNVFTEGQVSRMVTVMENSVRRASLLQSPGLALPAPVANDLAVAAVTVPTQVTCTPTWSPVVSVVNAGTNAVNSATLQVSVNGVVMETKSFSFVPALAVGARTGVSFSAHTFTTGEYEVAFEILETNGMDDGNFLDNYESITTLVPGTTAVPFSSGFDTVPDEWLVVDPDKDNTWSVRAAPGQTTSNNALYLNIYNNRGADGETDLLWTPVFNLTATVSPYLLFDVAYAQYPGSEDALKVYVLTDCQDLADATMVYNRSGASLATAAATTTAFVPSGLAQWRREAIDLSAFSGYDKVQLIFAGVNDGGNNLFIDNIKLVQQVSENLAVTQVTGLSPVRCGKEAVPAILVENAGGVPVTSVNVRYTLNGGAEDIVSFSGISIPPAGQAQLTLPAITLADGTNTLSLTLFHPNDLFDIDTTDNAIAYTMAVNDASDRIPLREDFNSAGFTDLWTALSPYGGMPWTVTSTNYNQSFFFDAYNNENLGDEAWLVSPVLDLSDASAASVFFDYSYRKRAAAGNRDSAYDVLRVLASRDCGNTFNEVLFNEDEESLSAIDKAAAWIPDEDADWTRPYLDLTGFAGESQLRLAFVFTNGHGNNLYLDNVEFYTSDDPTPFSSTDLYTVHGNQDQLYITFNLENRQGVYLELIDVLGRQLAKQELTDVLNQTYPIRAAVSQGVYIVRLKIRDRYYATRLYAGS